MAIDLRLLEEAESSETPLTSIRLYQWDRPTVSVGLFQEPCRAANLAYCEEHGIPVVVRPTGGRAVLHHLEVTYSVVSNDERIFSRELASDYLKIARALQLAFRRAGIETSMAPSRRETRPALDSRPCFLSPARHELLFQGKKLAGSAQRRLRKSFLQHGSIPLEIDYALAGAALGVAEDSLRLGMTSLSEAAKRVVTFDEMSRLLPTAFADALAIDLLR